jgi:uncharacterized protein (TIGR02145 family)
MKTKNRNWLFLFLIMGVILILVYGCPGSDENNNTTSITDKDGNVNTSVSIGTQVWIVENLKTTKFNDGSAIPNVTVENAWDNLTTPAYCWNNNDIANKNPYGALYNWNAVSMGKLCPTGWHVPTTNEWNDLGTYLGGYEVAGGKMKETGTTHWQGVNSGATNESGFTALPGGCRGDLNGDFYGFGCVGHWWTSSGNGDYYKDAKMKYLSNGNVYLLEKDWQWYFGLSVRYLKD